MVNPSFEYDDEFETQAKTVRFPTEFLPHAPDEYEVAYSDETRQTREQRIHQLSLVLHQPDEESCTAPAYKPPYGSNQRQFARCPIEDERTAAVLTVEGRKFECRLVQMSIGGFGVMLSASPRFESGAVGCLNALGLNHIVAVSRQEMQDDGLYVGLRQIEEVIDPDQIMGPKSPLIGYAIAGMAAAFVIASAYCVMTGR